MGATPPTDHPAFSEAQAECEARIQRLLSVDGHRTVDSFHRELGLLMWDHCGMARNEGGLNKALDRLPGLREEFWAGVKVPGTGTMLNQGLEKAQRVADFLELAELMCIDALHRSESCGGHFREESQTPEGEAQRDDDRYSYVAAWEHANKREAGDGEPGRPVLHKEALSFEYVKPTQRSYR